MLQKKISDHDFKTCLNGLTYLKHGWELPYNII